MPGNDSSATQDISEPHQCAYPSLPPPVPVQLSVSAPHPCPYLPGRESISRAFYVERLQAELYHSFMDANFRRSGRIVYQPICRGCRQCMSLRVPVARFAPGRSQRRCWNANQDLAVQVQLPALTDEKWELYRRYQLQWHGACKEDRTTFEHFLYTSPVESIEFTYRDQAHQLLGAGICDVWPGSLSSVYFYFEPEQSRRGLGTFAAMQELLFASKLGIAHYYMGYWVKDSPAMAYKASFRPCEILHPDGQWRALAKNC